MQSHGRRTIPGALALMLACLASAGASSAGDATASAATPTGGQHDFDWEIGTWTTRVRRLARPLSGSREWLEYEGTSVVHALLDGQANLVELRVSGPAGRIEGVSLRLYEPQAQRWSLNYASVRDGLLTPAVYGGFDGARGEFRGRDTFDGKPILVRFVITRHGDDAARFEQARFEQAFSADGGATWETNWIATDVRVRAAGSP